MLFPYKYIKHDISRLQVWVDYLFIHVWCSENKEYSFNLFERCPELKRIVEIEEIKEDPTVRGNDYITGPIREIFTEFKKLTPLKRKQLRKWYKRNKRIDKICNNEKLFKPLSAEVLESFSVDLAKKLQKFYVNLFEHALDLVVIRGKNGNLENHYKMFVKPNNNGICPFCGLASFRSYEMVGHEAYDHYLPKAKYPLSSINFKNLVPSCHHCNTIHKSQQSPILNETTKTKRKAFYPYSAILNDINIEINVDISNYKVYEHRHIGITFSGPELDKIQTWKDVYNIEKRYKDELTNEGSGKYWLVEYLDEMTEMQRKDALKDLSNKLDKSKFKGKNFLKTPFLLACVKDGLFK